MSFRISAKHFFLTYPHCDVLKEDALRQLSDTGVISRYIITEEKHKDGTPHLHATLEYDRKRNIKSQSFFDLKGKDGKNWHGEYEACRNYHASINYCKKAGDYIESDEVVKETLIDVCRKMDPEQFLQYCVDEKIQKGYYDEAKRLCTQTFTIVDEESYPGIIKNPKPNPKIDCPKQYDLWSGKNFSLTQLLSGDQWLSSEKQDVARPQSPDLSYQNLRYSLLTSTHSSHLCPDTIEESSSTICPSTIYQEKLRSNLLTANNQEQFISDMGLLSCQPESVKYLQETDFHLYPTMEQLREELAYLL